MSLKKILFIAFFTPLMAMATPAELELAEGQVLLEANDAGEMVIGDMPTNEDTEFSPLHHKYFHYKLSFDEVTRVITQEVEEAFDLFIFANVSYEKYGSPNDYIPSQHMRVFRKKYSGAEIFNRDMLGRIQPHNPVSSSALGTSNHQPALPGLPGEIKISSGAGHHGSSYVDTFSGVFRLNTRKSKSRRYQEGMIHSLYVDIKYPWGKVSGIAVHGTPKNNYRYLGRQASHGCIRVRQSVALPLYEYSMSPELFDAGLLDFSRSQRLPVGPLRNPRPGQKVLMVYFYGYNGNQGLDK